MATKWLYITENKTTNGDGFNTEQLTKMSDNTKIQFTRVNNDVNGNPRYVCHFLDVLTDPEYWQGASINERYNSAIDKMRPFGGKKYRGREFGGMIVFTTSSPEKLEQKILSTLK